MHGVIQLRNEALMRMISSRLDRWNSLIYSIYLTVLFFIAQSFILLRPRLQLQCIRDPLLMNIDFLVIFWLKIYFPLYIFIQWKQILIVFQNLELKTLWCWHILPLFRLTQTQAIRGILTGSPFWDHINFHISALENMHIC